MAQAQKCVHKGCGKTFTEPQAKDGEGDCVYHPGPPEFHEGQKGWKCCKPRVLTFDEFLEIPPCTRGQHSAVDDTPVPEKRPTLPAEDIPTTRPIAVRPIDTAANGQQTSSSVTKPSGSNLTAALPPPRSGTSTPQPLEEDSDPDVVETSKNSICKRRGCGKSPDSKVAREDEECIFHPGVPVFHEGSKGWTCCKRRVLEFDEFMKIEGCKTRKKHCYVGKRGKKSSAGNDGQAGASAEEEVVEDVRNDFYQTSSSVIVSFYLKKIDKSRAKVDFQADGKNILLDLPTSDGKRFKRTISLYAPIDPGKSRSTILGTKLEMNLVKADGASWPVLRSDDKQTGSRIQVGRAGRA